MAKTEIAEGRVTVGGAPALKASRMVDPAEDIQLLSPPRFVSRAGRKLEGALEAFGVNPHGLVCLDAGSSTGGFTDCLLQEGAVRVVAVDVGTHQLHEKIRSDERVQVREQTDVRSVTAESLGGPVDLVVGDLSFISLKLVLPTLFCVVKPGSDLLLLIKPQFEAGRREVSRGSGVITNPLVWQRVLTEIWHEANDLGGAMVDVVVSPITGRTGNVEFVARFRANTDESMEETGLQQVVIDATKDGML
jgi:23S rRNA (cytidine1920-2'-O)/16S rRNA (cytidine1409-2'-O)-methyltransferase